MIAIFSGAAALLAGASFATIVRHRSSDNTVEAFILSHRALTPAVNEVLDAVSKGLSPKDVLTPIHLTQDDLKDIFWNSRVNVCVANRMRRAEPDIPEWCVILTSMRAAHAKTRWLILLSAIELIVGRLGLGMYARVLLWTYGEELELLSQISERCSPLEGTAIQAIL